MKSTRFVVHTAVFFFILLSRLVQAQEANHFASMALNRQEKEEFVKTESYVEQIRRRGAVLELSLKDAIKLALTNNLEIAIEDYNEDLNRERIVATRGFYDPILNFRVGLESTENPTTSIIQAGQGIVTFARKGLTWNSSLDQNMPGGGAFSLRLDNSRDSSNSAFSRINPAFGSVFDVSFTQPLWRGFLKTQTERQLKLYNLDTQISYSQFKQRVSEIVQQVENQYWELVFAIDNHETRRESMELAILQHQNNQKRVQIGVMAPIETTQSRAEVATREQEMIQSEVQIITYQNALKRLLASDPRASIWNLTLIPTDRPQIKDVQITLEEAIQEAIERRPELEQVHLQLDKTGVDRDYLKKEGKPAVNLVANFGSVGRSGLVFSNVDFFGTPTTREPDPEDPLFGNLSNALGQAFGFDFINYGVSVDIQIPLRNRSNQAELAQAAITERQLRSRLKNQQQLIIVDVRNAFESIATQKKRLEAARMARQLSEEQLEGENKRFEAGLSTNFEVLRFQRDLTEAQVRELRAQVDYQLAITALLKAMYTIVDEKDIVLAGGKAGQ